MPTLFKLRTSQWTRQDGQVDWKQVDTVVGINPSPSVQQDNWAYPNRGDIRLDSAAGQRDFENDLAKVARITLFNTSVDWKFYPEIVFVGHCEEYQVSQTVEEDEDYGAFRYTPKHNPNMTNKLLRVTISPLGTHYGDYELARELGFDGAVDKEK